MARVNFAFILLLAAHIASTSAIYYECTNENYKNCIKTIGDLDKETENDVICEPLTGMKICLNSVHSSCGNTGEHTYTKNEIESKLDEIEGRLGGCPKDDLSGGSITVFGAADCTLDGFWKCTANIRNMTGDANEKCRIWWQSQGCLMDLYNCDDGLPGKDAADQLLGSMKQDMFYCSELATCSIEKNNYCLERAEMDLNRAGLCSKIEEAKHCIEDLTKDCEDTYVMRVIQTETLPRVYEKMKRCQNDSYQGPSTEYPWKEPSRETTRYPWAEPTGETTHEPWAEPNGETTVWAEPNGHGCTEMGMKECVRSVQEAYRMEDKCRAAKGAQHCLRGLMGMCYDQDDSDKMNREFMPWVDRILNNCSATPYPSAGPNGHGCTEMGMKECVRSVHEAYRMEDKCRAAKGAQHCLRGLMGMCYDQYDSDKMNREFMPWVDRILNNCMYGNNDGSGTLTGDDQGGWHPSAAVSTHAQSSTFVALLTALVVKMIASRF